MVARGEVVWAGDPFRSASENPRPWLVVGVDSLPYSEEESIAVALTTQTHHPGSLAVPGAAWLRGEPGTPSHVLPWTLATLKNDRHVVGVQGAVTPTFTERVSARAISYLDG